MRSIIAIFALTVVLQAQGFHRPDQIKKDGETELHKYFPRAVVMVSAEREAIIGFTCAANLGDSTINELTALVDRTPALQQLKEALQHGDLQEYRLFALGFDQNLIRIDPNHERSEIVGVDQVEDYRNLYAQYCGSPQTALVRRRRDISGSVFSKSTRNRLMVSREASFLKTHLVSTPSTTLIQPGRKKSGIGKSFRWFLKEQEIKVISIQLKSIEKIRLDDKDIPR